MQLLDSTYKHQSNLAAYCRTGKLLEIPGIISENVSQYRRLVYNVVDDMLQNAYPLTVDLFTKKEWDKTVNDFFTNHPCQSPQVWYMPKEFYNYLTEIKNPLLKKYPFLAELLWFEWVEVELFMMQDKIAAATKSGDVLFSKLVLNPEHLLLSFQYPVHKKHPKKIKETDKGNYFIIAHRNDLGDVVFTDSSAALIRMIEYLAEAPLSLTKLFSSFEKEYNLTLTEADQKAIALFFENALQQQLIIGFKN